MADLAGLDEKRARAMLEAENARFAVERPKSMALLQRARRSMPRGVPMSWMDDPYEHPQGFLLPEDGPTVSVTHDERHVDRYVEPSASS